MNLTEEIMNLTEEMQQAMPGAMGNTFYGNVSHDNSKEYAIMGLIKNQIMVLNDELEDAYRVFGKISVEEENWSAKFERKQYCKILEGQIAILNKLHSDFENMFTPTTMTPN